MEFISNNHVLISPLTFKQIPSIRFKHISKPLRYRQFTRTLLSVTVKLLDLVFLLAVFISGVSSVTMFPCLFFLLKNLRALNSLHCLKRSLLLAYLKDWSYDYFVRCGRERIRVETAWNVLVRDLEWVSELKLPSYTLYQFIQSF